MRDLDDYEPHHESSPTDHVLNELQLHATGLSPTNPDQRLLPTATRSGAVADIFDALIVTLIPRASNSDSSTISGRPQRPQS